MPKPESLIQKPGQKKDALQVPVLLDKSHDRNAFDCGVPVLNDYLKQYAFQNQKKNAARTYVAMRGNRVVGYYTLAYGSVDGEAAPASVKAGMPRHPIPVILLARLAVDQSEKGQGLGKGLLKDALLRTVQAADIAGLRAVMVHAKDDAARRFYEKHDFVSSPLNAYQLFLTLTDLKAILGLS